MLVKLIEIVRSSNGAINLCEVFVNSTHIISVSEETSDQSLIKENLGLREDVRFSSLLISEGYRTRKIVVVGSPSEIHNKVKKRQVLRG